MHAVLVLFQPLLNVGIQNCGMWGMYNLAKAYRNIKNPFANRRVEDWEATNGHIKDTTWLFHGPWHNTVGKHICAQPLGMWNRLRFHMVLHVSQIFQRQKVMQINRKIPLKIIKFNMSGSINPQNHRDLNQDILHLKFGDPSLKRWWVMEWKSSKWDKFWLWS